MIFQQFLRRETGCASYLIGSGVYKTAAVIDPNLEVERYLEEAKANDVAISHIIETHVHADHLSTARKLQAKTGAALLMPAGSDTTYPFQPLREGDEVRIGEVSLTVLHTPGHTPESICLLGADRPRGRFPWFVLTGDTLMVGDVGRPDLILEGAPEDLAVRQAGDLYESIYGKLLPLDDCIEVYPSHYGFSPCGGTNMNSKPVSTIGYERRFSFALKQPSREQFVRFVMAGLRPQPEAYRDIKRKNMGRE